MSYLYWSYGNPNDLGNLIKRYFDEKPMINFKEKLKKVCYPRNSGFLLTDYHLKWNDNQFYIKPEWIQYALLYSDYIDPGEKDETLKNTY